MADRSILCCGPMLRAVIEGRKPVGMRWADIPWVRVIEFNRVEEAANP